MSLVSAARKTGEGTMGGARDRSRGEIGGGWGWLSHRRKATARWEAGGSWSSIMCGDRSFQNPPIKTIMTVCPQDLTGTDYRGIIAITALHFYGQYSLI